MPNPTDPALGLDPISQMDDANLADPPPDTITPSQAAAIGSDEDIASGDRYDWGEVERFLDRAANPDGGTDPAAGDPPPRPAVDPTEPGSNPDPDAIPAPGVDPNQHPVTPTVDPDTGIPAGEPQPQLAPPPAPADDVLEFGDLKIPRTEVEQLARWAASLTPEDRLRVDQALAQPAAPPIAASGSSVPAGGAPASPAGYVPQPAGQVGMPVAPQVPDLAVLGEVAPELAPFLQGLVASNTQLQQELATYQATAAQQAQFQAQQEQERTVAALDAGREAFTATHSTLLPADIEYLTQRAAQMQVMPALVREHRGDVAKAYQQAMETAMWADPQYRQRVVQASTEQYAEDSAGVQNRRQKAEALTGAAGSAPRTAQRPNPAQMNREQRMAAMAAELAAARDQSAG